MTGVELIAGAALGLAVDVAKDGVNGLRQGDFAKRLARKTVDDVGGPLRKSRLRKWLYRPVAWNVGSARPSPRPRDHGRTRGAVR